MKKLLVVVDMQNDFVSGVLGSKNAQKIVGDIVEYIKGFDGDIIATQDTHEENYLETQEGKNLPVKHCIYNSDGWKIVDEISEAIEEKKGKNHLISSIIKRTFGSTALGQIVSQEEYDVVEICGVCTDICVISNALLIKAFAKESKIIVHKDLCAGVSEESHENALKAMAACQIEVV